MTHTTIRDVCIAFGYEVDKQSEKKANESVDKLKSYASKALGAIAIYFTVRGLSSLAEAAANAEALRSQFSQVFGDIEEQAANTMKSIADETGVSAGRMRGSFVQIAAFAKTSGMDTENALGLTDRAMRAVADSAAFYDKSLEDVTSSLQSFLKGNFANDAALGLSATETTRNAAANALYGKSFKDLAESQKQLTLLKMVEDANTASGALGQAARESDTWGNQLGNLKQSLTDLKAVAGGAFLKPAIQVLKLFSVLVGHATDAVRSLTAEGRLLNRMFERTSNWLKKAQVYIERFVKKTGGAENAFKLLAIAAASVFVAMNSGAILSFLKNLTGLLNPLNLKVLAIAAVVAMLFLAVDDFISFMQGNGSVIGAVFERWGIDADGVRQTIIAAWDAIKASLEKIWLNLQEAAEAAWGAIKAMAEAVFGRLEAFWEAWGGTIRSIFDGLWAALGESFQNATDAIIGILDLFAAIFAGDWEGAWDAAKDIASAAWDEIVLVFTTAKDAIAKAFDVLYEKIGPFAAVIAGVTAAVAAYKIVTVATAAAQAIMAGAASGMTVAQLAQAASTKAVTAAQWLLNAAMSANPVGVVIALIAGLVAAFVLLWKKNEGFRNFFIGMFGEIVNTVRSVFENVKQIFNGIVDFISGVFTGNWEKAWQGLKDIFLGIVNSLVELVKAPMNAIINVINGVIGGLNGIKIPEWVPGLGGKGINIPLIPRLAKGSDFSPDTFIAGEKGPELITGAKGRKVFTASETSGVFGAIEDALNTMANAANAMKSFGTDMMALAQSATASPATVQSMVTSTMNRNVTQTNYFESTFNGERAAQKRMSESMGRNAEDAAGMLARALAYER